MIAFASASLAFAGHLATVLRDALALEGGTLAFGSALNAFDRAFVPLVARLLVGRFLLDCQVDSGLVVEICGRLISIRRKLVPIGAGLIRLVGGLGCIRQLLVAERGDLVGIGKDLVLVEDSTWVSRRHWMLG